MQVNELFRQSNTILLDGGMGTMLQAAGLKLGACPEELNITDPALIEGIHGQYAAAGSRIVNANTFGASAHKLAGSTYTLEQVITAGIENCKRACAPYGALTALDVGPLGELLEPSGTLAFEDAVAEYARIVKAGEAAGADLIFFETYTDLYELKAALLAAKENTHLPILASMSFEAGGRTFTGCTVESFAATARGLGADAVGINCSLGPKEIFPMAKRLAEAVPGNFPVFVKPNAGLPRADGSGYDITPQLFALQMKPYRELHLFAAGGCCGTTPEFIKLLNGTFAGCTPGRPAHRMPSVLCTPVDTVTVDGITVVGERINPTGKKRFQQALREGDMNYVLEQAVSQAEAGAQILDVNVGAPGVDEPVLMEQVVKALQSVTSLPLQLDSSNVEALARGLRVYNGKPIVNSTNGEPEKLAAILPLCKKYGAAIVGLAIDEKGIQPKAADRVAIARRITEAALAAGIPREDIYIDCLTLTASAQQEDVLATVQALEACKKELGVRTVLGVSNISFGLPCRTYLNTTFLTMAMYAGLDLAIMNPSSEEMMAAVYAYNVLTNRDKQSTKYIERFADRVPASTALAQAAKAVPAASAAEAELTGPYAALMKAVEKGLKGDAAAHTRTLLAEKQPLEVVDEALIPALDIVGAKYEKGTLFLPQLLQAASAAQSAFEEIKTAIAQKGEGSASKGRIVLATVKGDVHDIGKNIVRVILENYGFEVLDLGRDVPVETVVDTVREKDVHLVGLSALMTTTLKSMEETIAALRAAKLDCKIMVGGAVLTPEYAEKIGADWYAKDAKRSADIAKEFFGV
ncbi:homocysteine S-methyltransferase family protein [Faecalibacterium prausnitzii]|uniref:homocysteine S-methyltransferase family protein n=1 Tax=Faecalibacterium prausnitzii TaxID=853 RepID=UPI001020FC2E|nr:homocysteine S-methyltransferase family protein [Faecalibacterium prausnitzii]MDR3768753.1 homocysteine S-methyltransferase family protein [Faecalibacterium sp.]MSC65997.1 homocysteine methyltransferase [Faecalibacterium prausnitzii]MSC72045.1 homocysteine methyltransferase [Faecalibacterium prausnitzii]MSC97059.1 homocysteine methyltransferase [Faecalibacterium prausnitzii]MSD37792.1 homocysteine methyltransferase [Faecalibacterium prausnitzii]